jgi:hypothetical protein
MRKQLSTLHLLFAVLALVLTVGVARPAFADDRADARTHYQAGTKAYASGDYKAAIREFAAAQQLVPADLNSYNLALCYDKLGDAEPAMQYYREYLNKVPNTDKRGEIEASMARLDGAAKSAAAKRAEDDRRADEAKRAEDQRRADEARRTQQPDPSTAPPPPAGGIGPTVGVGPSVGATVGPGTGTPPPAMAPTGDPNLDRVQSIDINQIRTQRGTVGGPNPAAPTTGPAPGPAVAANGQPIPGQPGAGGPMQPNGLQPATTPGAPAVEVEVPVYKKWWFWAVVGVSLYVVYEIATENSNNNESTARGVDFTSKYSRGTSAPQGPQGLTLMRW